MKDIDGFIGVYSHDTLPNLNHTQNNTSLIINYHNEGMPGSHWVACYNNEFYDSFGIVPSKTIQDWLRKTYHLKKGDIQYPSHQQQHLTSVLCGYYCIYYITQRNKGFSMYDILYSMLDFDTFENETIIKKFIMDKL